MKKLKLNAVRLVCLLLLAWHVQTAMAQGVIVKKPGVVINGNCHGYIEYLPPNYNPATADRHPLLIFFNGHGTQGSGSITDLQSFFNGGGTPPEQCDLGWWV